MSTHDSTVRTVVITGANAGIGRRAAELLASQGHAVVAVARSQERGSRAVSEIRAATGSSAVSLEIADMADPESITALAERLRVRHEHVDALINNAAVFDQTATHSLTRHGHEQVWATNHLGPFLLTAELSSLLARSDDARVVTVASKGLMVYPRIAIRWDDLSAEGWFTPTRAYYHSKLAQVMFAATLARRVASEQLVSVALRVPAVRLDADRLAAMPWALRLAYLPKNRFAMSPDQLASTYARLVVGPRDAVAPLHGCYVDEDIKPVAAPRYARDEAAQDRLWQVTSAQVDDPVWQGLDRRDRPGQLRHDGCG